MHDLLLTGGRIVTSEAIREADIAIADGRIASLHAPGLAVEARRRIDGSGRL